MMWRLIVPSDVSFKHCDIANIQHRLLLLSLLLTPPLLLSSPAQKRCWRCPGK
jgi:hypothetical protein